jgi:hypothetical protein
MPPLLSDTSGTILCGLTDDVPINSQAEQADRISNLFSPCVFETHSENLYAPHILRALSNVKMTRIFSGPSAMHCVGIDGESDDVIVMKRTADSECGVWGQSMETLI